MEDYFETILTANIIVMEGILENLANTAKISGQSLTRYVSTRCTSIWTKLSYQFLDWTIVRHCPKGQLGQIWVNLGQN